MTRTFNKSEMKERRRALRKSMIPAEALLWKALRNSRLIGCRFERQYSVGNFIVDFYSPKVKLAIKVNGPIHDTPDAIESDKLREDQSNSLGIRMLRFKNEEVEHRFGDVLKRIAGKIRESSGKQGPGGRSCHTFSS